MANINNKSRKNTLSSSLLSTLTTQGFRSKVFKRQAIHLIRFCLKSGITKNKEIMRLLKENEIDLRARTFDRYKSLAEKELENDLGEDIWLSEKVQNGLVHDYKDISDRYDRQLVLDDMLMQSLVRQAVDKAMTFDNDPDKYYRHLDFSETMKIQAISNYTMKNKLELISRGFMVYKIKQHIEYLENKVGQKQSKIESKELDLSSLAFLTKSNVLPQQDSEPQNKNEEYGPEYLAESNLVIGMNGRPIKKYLADIEKKLGKPLSSI